MLRFPQFLCGYFLSLCSWWVFVFWFHSLSFFSPSVRFRLTLKIKMV